jgi:hypothetical protein
VLYDNFEEHLFPNNAQNPPPKPRKFDIFQHKSQPFIVIGAIIDAQIEALSRLDKVLGREQSEKRNPRYRQRKYLFAKDEAKFFIAKGMKTLLRNILISS